MFSWAVVKYVLTAALRDRLVLALFLLMGVGASLAIFLGSAAVSESDQFAVVFAAAGLRLSGVMGLVLFVVFYLRRSFDSRDVDFLLSRPVSRMSFIFSHSLAFMILACIVTVFVCATVCMISPHLINQGYMLWGFSLLIEYMIIVNVALFFAMVLPNAAAGTLAIFGFYLLARLIGQILGIIDAGFSNASLPLLGTVMHMISLGIPRLDLMGQTSWLIYGVGSSSVGAVFILVQGIVYSALVILASSVDLIKRQF